ncbi:glutathione hydrolase 5 proenzyme [Tiliqua scincoides]|uniref:glutathione hydrolase 5 proenzyme n=1 Tax=Tiliqua scincoides TaxID=71010 RepID=UPI0034627766
MGLGGGVIFTIYNASTGEVEVINARETAPKTMAPDLLNDCRDSFLPGAKWIAVPGELRGYEAAHRRHGRLPWKALFEPTIKFLEPGVEMSVVLNRFLSHPQLEHELRNSSLSKLFLSAHGAILQPGETLHWPALVKTLRAVGEHGAKEFYSGETARKLVADVRKQGGSLTLDDLGSYQVRVVKALNISLGNYAMYSAPEPAAGPIIFFILNVLKGFNFTKESMSTPGGSATAYHYIAEALKFANGQRPKVEDPKFSGAEEGRIRELISDAFADHARQQIDGRGNHTASHYNLSQRSMGTFGTSHVSVLAEDGSAVSVTSTINHPFGSMVYSDQTGIILNNELVDFCMKQSSKTVSPGEMPPSSMAPSILISRDGQSKLVIGGSGGQSIVPALTLAIANKLWFGYDLDRAIRAPILSATTAGLLEFERGFRQDVVAELRRRGHRIREAALSLNVVQGISQDGPCIFPYSDVRKNGMASGY